MSELMRRTNPPVVAETVVGDDEMLSVKAIHPTPRGRNTDITREKTVIKEREVLRQGPDGRFKEVDMEEELERDMVTHDAPPVQTLVPPATTMLPSSVSPAKATTRINPRTGKPLSIPTPLSLSPHNMSPIQEAATQHPGGQLIREEHEEVSGWREVADQRLFKGQMEDRHFTPTRLRAHILCQMARLSPIFRLLLLRICTTHPLLRRRLRYLTRLRIFQALLDRQLQLDPPPSLPIRMQRFPELTTPTTSALFKGLRGDRRGRRLSTNRRQSSQRLSQSTQTTPSSHG